MAIASSWYIEGTDDHGLHRRSICIVRPWVGPVKRCGQKRQMGSCKAGFMLG